MSKTSQPRATNASAISERWHLQGTASAHISDDGVSEARAAARDRPRANSGVSMKSA